MKTDTSELPEDARDHLPPLAQRMFLETLRNARAATLEESEAQRVAWDAVRRKYEPKPGMRLWFRKDWRSLAKAGLPPG